MSPKSIVLINGSPRAPKGNSETLITELSRLLTDRGVTTKTVCAIALSAKPAKFDELASTLRDADGVWLVFPLYKYTLPACLVETLEELAARVDSCGESKPWLTALSQCGFPEPWHNECALDSCELFAKQVGMPWRGRLPIGMGALIDPAHASKHASAMIRRVLETAVEDIGNDQSISDTTIQLAAKPMVSGWVYRMMCNYQFVRAAFKSATLTKMYARPHRR
jgi:hypothetical protein